MPDNEPTKRLTDLELEIMQVVWDVHPSHLTVREVVDRLAKDGHELAYTTIQTMMTILKRKGVIDSRPGPGRAHEYSTRVTRSEARSNMTQDFVERLFSGQAEPLLAHLLGHESVSREELEALKARIETHLSDDEELS